MSDDGKVVSIDRERAAKRGFVPTSVYAQMSMLLRYCLDEADTGLVIGQPGVGKTVCAQAFVEEHNQDAILVAMGAVTARPIEVLGRLCHACGFPTPWRASPVELHQMMVDQIRHRLLILDEAHYLDQAAADAVRDLADAARIGVVFVGNATLSDRWLPLKAGKGTASPQFTSRIGPQLRLDTIDDSDVDSIVAARGALTDGAAALEFMRKVARSAGHLRAVDKIIRLAAHRSGGRPPALRELQRAAAMCGIRF